MRIAAWVVAVVLAAPIAAHAFEKDIGGGWRIKVPDPEGFSRTSVNDASATWASGDGAAGIRVAWYGYGAGSLDAAIQAVGRESDCTGPLDKKDYEAPNGRIRMRARACITGSGNWRMWKMWAVILDSASMREITYTASVSETKAAQTHIPRITKAFEGIDLGYFPPSPSPTPPKASMTPSPTPAAATAADRKKALTEPAFCEAVTRLIAESKDGFKKVGAANLSKELAASTTATVSLPAGGTCSIREGLLAPSVVCEASAILPTTESATFFDAAVNAVDGCVPKEWRRGTKNALMGGESSRSWNEKTGPGPAVSVTQRSRIGGAQVFVVFDSQGL